MDVIFSKLQKVTHQYGDAAMFDIDDTLIRSSDKEVITDTKKLLEFCKNIGLEIIIITARPLEGKIYTEQQLKDAGIYYDKLFFVAANDKGTLKQVLDNRFVLSVGDLETDCTDSMYSLKLPGPADYNGFFSGPA
jgi:hydroxymethylpyrimidine pyrophosphatase-like HAD family hydrolase